jgi:hypothetical protein
MVELLDTFEETAMSHVTSLMGSPVSETLPAELVALMERVQTMPARVRAELEPMVDDVLDHARFRSRVLTVAREALEQLRLDLELARFDLEATRRERESLRERLADQY